jgi:uncharacterized protein
MDTWKGGLAMTRRTWVLAAAALVAGLMIWFAATAFAQDGGPPSAKPARTITVDSTATVKVPPEEAVVDLGVHSESPDGATAFARNAQDMQAVLDALRAAGIADKDVQTTNVSLDTRVEDRGKPDERKVFVASNTVQVKVHDLSAVGSVIDAAVQAGADSVHDIRFQLENANTVRTDALTQVVEGARTKADALARAAGAEVVRVVTIDEQNYRAPVYRAPMTDQALLAAPAPTPVVPPDSLQVTETISVVWEIA